MVVNQKKNVEVLGFKIKTENIILNNDLVKYYYCSLSIIIISLTIKMRIFYCEGVIAEYIHAFRTCMCQMISLESNLGRQFKIPVILCFMLG